jgi:hypothetical protein
MRFTGYNDSLTYLFMRFLDYTEAFLLATCEYDLYVDISKKMLEFEQLNASFFRKETATEP